MQHHVRRVAWVAVIVASILPIASPVFAATPTQVDKAIERAKKYLYSQQKEDGSWEMVNPANKPDDKDAGDVKGWQWGGLTSIATYALLAGGESPQEPHLAKAIDFLKKHSTDMNGVYAVGMRCQVWPFLQPTVDVKDCIKRDATFLQEALFKDNKKDIKAKGFYCYHKLPKQWDPWFDRSVSQYGVLGMWACAQAGIEVSTGYWQDVEEGWMQSQRDDGGWTYNDKEGQVKHSMTAAGVATLFLTQDFIRPGEGISCKGNIVNEKIDKGLQWWTNNFPPDIDKLEWRFYTLYGIERIGVASGYKYFGTIDWYQLGAEYLIHRQDENDGSWFSWWPKDYGHITDTSWGILFLARGRAPVVMNKLQYDTGGSLGNWNQRPRDCADIAAWMGKQTERYLNWQIVNLKVPVEELADAPILYMSGNQDLKLADADAEKLKTYIEQGGLILGNADCGNKEFADSFRKLGQKLFPAYEFRELPTDHPIYTEEQYPRTKWKTPASVLALSNGARELMILLPAADPGRAWQMQDNRAKADLFQLGSDIFLYTVERQNLRYKGVTHIISRGDDKTAGSKTIKVARLEYAGNWNPEPGGWRRLSNLMHKKNRLDLQIESVKLGAGKLDSSFKIAHLTGTAAFKLSAAERGELKKFVDGGGTIVIDAAGGSTQFATAAEAELAAIFPDSGKNIAPIAKSHAAFSNLPDLELRKYTVKVLGKSRPPLPRGIESNGRMRVFYSPLDLSVGIVGQTVDGVAGYSADSATDLMSAIVLYASRG